MCSGHTFCVVASRKQRQAFGTISAKGFEATHTGDIGFSPVVAKELMFLNRTIKNVVHKDEMTQEVCAKLIDGTLTGLKLVCAKSFDTLRVGRHEEQALKVKNSEKSYQQKRPCTAAR